MYDNNFVKEMITAHKMNLRTAHEQIGLSNRISRYDNEPPTFEELEKIADYFNVSTDSLLGRTSNKVRNEIIESLKFSSPYPYNLIENIICEPINWKIEDKNVEGLEWAMSSLNERQTQMLLAYFKDGNSLREISEIYDVGRERVRQIIAKALRILRHPVKCRAIVSGMHSFEEVDEYAETVSRELDKREKELDEREQFLDEQEKLLNQKISEFNKSGTTEAMDNIETKFGLEIAEMDLSVRTYNCLARTGMKYLYEITDMLNNEPHKFLFIRNLGKKSGQEVVQKIDEILHTGNKYSKIYYAAVEKSLRGYEGR